MRLATLILIAAAAAPAAAAPSVTAVVDLAATVREAKVREAALRSVEGTMATLATDLAPAPSLAARMLADPAQHADPKAARSALAEAERRALEQAFRAQLESFARGREGLPEDWVDRVVREESERISTTIEGLLAESFAARFREARAAAVAEQREAVRASLYPSPQQLLDLVGDPERFAAAPNGRPAQLAAGPKARALARDGVAELRAGQGLFAEVEANLESESDAAVAAALDALWRQMGSVVRLEPPGAVRAEAIATALRADLDQLASTSALPYGVFAAASERVASRAEALQRERFVTALQEALPGDDACPGLPAPTVVAAAGDDVATMPVELDDHLRALRDELWAPTRKRLIARHAGRVEAEAQPEFSAVLEAMLAADDDLDARVRAMFTACLRAPLQKHREALAARELAAQLPQIADLSFALPDDDLAVLAVADERTDPTLFPSPAELRLRESRELFAARAAALQREARAAVRMQELLTRAPDRRKRFVREVETDENRTAERKRHYQRAYETEVLAAWRERRDRVLLRDESGTTLHPGKYDRIFPSTSEIIDEIITIEFERPAPTATVVPTRPSPRPTLPPRPTPPRVPRVTPAIERSGPMPEARSAGLPARAEPPRPLPRSGGAPQTGPGAGKGGPKSCEESRQSSMQAMTACYAALVQCRDDPDSCAAGVARCGQAKFASEPK